MLRARLRYSITSALTSSLLVLATPAVLAEAVSSKADATALLVADLAEMKTLRMLSTRNPAGALRRHAPRLKQPANRAARSTPGGGTGGSQQAP